MGDNEDYMSASGHAGAQMLKAIYGMLQAALLW